MPVSVSVLKVFLFSPYSYSILYRCFTDCKTYEVQSPASCFYCGEENESIRLSNVPFDIGETRACFVTIKSTI